MEPAGLAVGILGIAGLFNTCLDLVERFDSWRDFGNESHSLQTQFETHKIRLERWGHAIGFEKGNLANEPHGLLNDPRTLSNVKDLLLAIKNVCRHGDHLFPKPVAGPDKPHSTGPMTDRDVNLHAPVESKRQRLKWSLRNKSKGMVQVAQLSSLVDNLYGLVPVNGDHPARVDDGYPALPEDWAVEFKRILDKIEGEMENETRREISEWLLGSHSTNELYETYVRRRVESSCEWVLERPWFIDWSSPEFPFGRAKVHWLHGPAGFGKSILCAKIIEHLAPKMDIPVAYFFFSSDFESRGDPFVAIRSWLFQLMAHSDVFEFICDKWEAWKTTRIQRATRGELVNLLHEVVSAIRGCSLILDGLDECDSARGNSSLDDRHPITQFFQELGRVVADTPTRVMIISRDEPEIRHCLSNNCVFDSVHEYRITPDDVHNDVVSYSRSVVSERLPKKTESAKANITKRLADRCNGQFLWVKLQQNTLRSGKSQRRLEEAISATPAGLENIYERNWIKISEIQDENDRARAFSILRWTAFSLRPLTVDEISAALLIRDDCDELVLDDLPDIVDQDYINTEILDLCGSLLELRSPEPHSRVESKTLHLTHFSVKEYLLHNLPAQSWNIRCATVSFMPSDERSQNTALAKKCLRYANTQAVWLANCGTENDQVLCAFRNYAAGSWYKHAAEGYSEDQEFIALTTRLFDTRNPNWMMWKAWFDRKDTRFTNRDTTDEANKAGPLYYAAYLGLTEIFERLLSEKKHDVNEKGKLGQTVLGAACESGNLKIVTKLLAQGAEIAIPDTTGRTPLYTASRRGHAEIAALLIERGADINVLNEAGVSPICVASDYGHIEAVKLLLAHGADANVPTEEGWTPIHIACDERHLAVVKLLLEYGADINVLNRNGWTPLSAACSEGHLAIVKLLLEHGADINIMNGNGWTAISEASFNGHLAVVRSLLEHGAGINVPYENGWTPINAAAYNGHLAVMRLLLDHGADIHVPHENGWTPINPASYNGHLAAVKLLLEHGADIDVPNRNGWTPINAASSNGHPAVVKLLLEHGADINITNKAGWTPINAASCKGHTAVVELLLEHGADASVPNKNDWTPINAASSNGHLAVVKLLLGHGTNVDIPNKNDYTPIVGACFNGHLAVVKLLFEHGANINTLYKDAWTPLHIACARGDTEIVGFLLEHGAENTIQNVDGWTPLHAACHHGHLDALRLLLKYGSDITILSHCGETALHSASSQGHVEIVDTILQLSNINIDGRDYFDRTPLFCAAAGGHNKVVDLLLSRGALVNAIDRYLATPLLAAIRNGHEAVVRQLIPLSECDINMQDGLGRSLLWWVERSGKSEMLQIVLQCAQSHAEVPQSEPDILGDCSKPSRVWCDVCTRNINSGRKSYKCKVCFDFDICSDCFEADAKCFNASHEWIIHYARDLHD